MLLGVLYNNVDFTSLPNSPLKFLRQIYIFQKVIGETTKAQNQEVLGNQSYKSFVIVIVTVTVTVIVIVIITITITITITIIIIIIIAIIVAIIVALL